MAIGAVIFDLDGVIVDSEIWWHEARVGWAAERGLAWSHDDSRAVMGANSRGWARIMRERMGLPEVDEPAIEASIVRRVTERYRHGAPEIAGAAAAVRRIAATWPVAVASSAHREVIDAALVATGLHEVIPVVVSSDEVDHGKPEPDVYLEAARRLGVPPVDCLVVEDSINGVRAGVAAGMTVVLIPNASVPPAPGAADLAHHVLDRLADLEPSLVVQRDAPGSGGDRQMPGGRPVARDKRSAGASLQAMTTVDRLPRSDIPRWSRTVRYYASRFVIGAILRLLFRLRLEGRANLPGGPALLCFNHLNWTDPFVLYSTLPLHPRLFFFGPKEDDLRVGTRNRLMYWTGTAVPYRPAKSDLREVTRQVGAVFEAGGVLAIAGEGRIHVGERELLPVQDGAAYFALRAGVPIVPVAINGTSWLGFRRRLRVRIGQPIPTGGRATSEAVAGLTAATTSALLALVADAPEPGPPGRFGRWLTELFNDWPEGSREASAGAGRASGILSTDPGTD